MTLKSSDSRKWKSTQFNRSRKAGHNCLNHSLKAEVTAVEKASFIAACFRFSGWTCAAGPCRVEFMLKGNEAQNILHVALSVPWSFDFVAFSLAPCHCHANRGHNAKLATICGKLFRRFPIYYCTFSYRLYHKQLGYHPKGTTIFPMTVWPTASVCFCNTRQSGWNTSSSFEMSQLGYPMCHHLSRADPWTERYLFVFPLSGWMAERHAQVAEQGL